MGISFEEDFVLPSIQESEARISQHAERALDVLKFYDSLDLAPMLGLEHD